ncbi:MAG: hypothetical protein ABIJ94_01630 [candidate division WOR-3 bacterium]
MKFIDIEELYQKFPNKYLAIVKAAREVRKLNEERKNIYKKDTTPAENTDSTLKQTEEGEETTLLTVTKKRGRRPKKELVEIDKIKSDVKSSFSDKTQIESIIAEKPESNVYIEALKRILK